MLVSGYIRFFFIAQYHKIREEVDCILVPEKQGRQLPVRLEPWPIVTSFCLTGTTKKIKRRMDGRRGGIERKKTSPVKKVKLHRSNHSSSEKEKLGG